MNYAKLNDYIEIYKIDGFSFAGAKTNQQTINFNNKPMFLAMWYYVAS